MCVSIVRGNHNDNGFRDYNDEQVLKIMFYGIVF